MNPFERWDDWEWEKAIQELERERGGRPPVGGKRPYRRKTSKQDWLKSWSLLQKRTLLSALLFLTLFFSANGEDPAARAVRAVYDQGMGSGSYFAAMNEMAREAIGLGGLPSPALPVDVDMQGKFLPPLSGPVVAEFGIKNKEGQVHNGIDVQSSLGTKVVAPYDGVVTFVGEDPQLGKIITMDFGDGWTATLGNLGEVFIEENEVVLKGSPVGTVGLSAPLKQPWLHLELRKDGQAVDPLPYLNSSQTS